MTIKIYTYRDLPDDGFVKDWTVQLPMPGGLILKQGIIPGMFGDRDIHVSHYQIPNKFLITMTYEPVSNDLLISLVERMMQDEECDRKSI
jgi:hypothetical protein